ncbi:sulfatase-like hydrolase/transferase [Zobellia alginiliquefaciens]|uniref:sulfatase-like hydrolase/transferase n=1 Tax=Zobellia alginiliquefaciens TaxID=3032586 RepID=UPI0023E39FB5|nr:sulfatase-like hydrolase/transferase [Zobellia alginiliquefaciens]
MKKLIFCILGLLLFIKTNAQENDTKVVLITLDGLRWQELFSGADSLLVANKKYVHDTTALKSSFWKSTAKARREALMPFVWNSVSKMGTIHGNRELGSKVDLTNKMWFSYPGYNEILTGKADDARIGSNDKIPNPNTTVLEIANRDERYQNKVAAFGSWDVFPYIVNEERSGVPVNGGFEIAEGKDLSEREKFLNELQPKVPSPWSTVRLDAFTHYYAVEHMRKNHPELVYIAYGETDDFAHDGDYEAYLKSTHNTDGLIKNLYDFTQQDPFYKDKTLFIITTDHGRGTQPLETWKSHGENIKGAGHVWIILFGKGVSKGGEISISEQLYSNQIAPTLLKVLDLKNPSKNRPARPLSLN